MSAPEIISRKEAIARGLKRFYTGKPCVHKHMSERYVAGRMCCVCKIERRDRDKARHPERWIAYALRGKENAKRKGKVRKKKHMDPTRIISKVEAKARGLTQFYTGAPCKYGHNSARSVSGGACVECRYRRNKLNNQVLLRMTSCVLKRINLDLSAGQGVRLLKYDDKELKAHLKATLPKGMTYRAARADGWHGDHIVPVTLVSKALPWDRAGRLLTFKIIMDLENMRMVPGTENQKKTGSLKMDPEQERVFLYLCEKYGAADVLIAEAINPAYG